MQNQNTQDNKNNNPYIIRIGLDEAIVLSRKYKEYHEYDINYIEKDTSDIHFPAFKVFVNSFLHTITFSAIKMNKYCPYCNEKISDYEYNCTPLYTYGCYNCREHK